MADRSFSSIFNIGKASPHFPYIYDPNATINENPLTTGAWRPWTINDVGAVSISGGVSVGNVAVTGGSINIVGTPPVTVVNNSFPVTGAGGFFGLTGTANIAVTGGSISIVGPLTLTGTLTNSVTGTVNTTGTVTANVTGVVTIDSGSFALTINMITGSQVQIPVGVRAYSISVISGSAFINGNGPFFSMYTLNGGGYDGRWTLNTAINIGCTGNTGTLNACQTIVNWES